MCPKMREAGQPKESTLIDVFQDGGKEVWLWLAAMLGFLITIGIVLPYLWRLRCTPSSRTKRLYVKITLMPFIFATTAVISCNFLTSTVFCSCLQHFSEALALHSLNNLIIERLGGRVEAVIRLSHRGPQAWFRAPPLCCCFFCIPRKQFTERTLHLILAMTKQFILVVPTLSMAEVVLEIFIQDPENPSKRVVRALLALSALLALYGLFIMYKATYCEFSDHGITLKFIAIKLVILVGVIQQYALSVAAESHAFHGDQTYDAEDYASFLANAILCMESPFLTYLVLHGFPIEDLEDDDFKKSQERSNLLIAPSGHGDADERRGRDAEQRASLWWAEEEELSARYNSTESV